METNERIALLLKKARKAPDRRGEHYGKVAQMTPVIIHLREAKGYTYKQIAQWLNENTDIKTRAGSVYAAYTRQQGKGNSE